MNIFFSKHCRFSSATRLTGKTLFVVLATTMTTSIFLPLTMQRIIAQDSSQEVTQPTSQSQNPILQKVLGTWQVQPSMQPENLTFVFAPDGKLFLFSSVDKRGIELAYSIDTTTTPMHVDISLKNDGVVKTIAELTADGKLKMQIEDTQPGNQRPTKFAENVSIFNKVSDATNLPEGIKLLENTTDNPNPETEGKLYTGAMVRAQQAYFLEYSKFAEKIADLGIGEPRGEYNYSLAGVKPRSRSVMIVTQAKQANSKSYIGLVYVVDNGNEMLTIGGVCQTQQAITKIPPIPSAPKTGSSPIICPQGFELIN